MITALTIAGSDCSGGAGIQADIKTFASHGVYGMSVITALTAQNTLGVVMVEEVSAAMVEAQIDAVFKDIPPDAVKIGMVSSVDHIAIIAEKLAFYKPKHVVLDPVMVSTSGYPLIGENAKKQLIKYLFPLATIITPNLQEAQVIAEVEIKDKADMEIAARKMAKNYTGAILIKGGHLESSASDLLYIGGKTNKLTKEKIDNPNTHGTGCTLSSAIAANLAKGEDLEVAVTHAKDYVYGAIKDGLNIGCGRGPLNHFYKSFKS